ncbi:MAG: DMT family transporter [Eggerthellaceae bacterium]|nr:DMT family transporter [Eggerthellaceae bacterium]
MTNVPAGAPAAGSPGTSLFDRLPSWVYYAMLFGCTLLWGSSFFVVKDVTEAVSPATLVGIRFTIAAVLVLAFFFKRVTGHADAATVRAGLAMGAAYFLAYWAQTVGITDTTPGKNAFLTATYCAIVPFLYWFVARRRPSRLNIVCAALCLVGVGLVSLDGDLSMRTGDVLTLVGAVFFAAQIALMGKYAGGKDVMALTFWQFAVTGVASLVAGAATEPALDPEVLLAPSMLAQVAYLTFFVAFLACLMQNVGQTHVPPAQASLILCLESVFGVLFSVVFYGETLAPRVLLGFVVIFIAIVSSEVLATKEFKWPKRKTTSS